MPFSNIIPAPTETPVSDKDGRMTAVWQGWYQTLRQQLMSGEFRVSDAELARIAAFITGAGTVVTPPPPVVTSCVGTVFNGAFPTYGTGVRLTAPTGFDPGTNWVVSLTTPASSPWRGRVDFYEFLGANASSKTISLSKSPCGPPLSAIAVATNLDPSIRFALNSTNFPAIEVVIQPSTTYYFSMQVSDVGGSAAEINYFA